MPIYTFESSSGERIEELFTVSSCPERLRKDGVTYYKVLSPPSKPHIAPETNSPEYQKWFHSDEVQSKLKSGEYEIAPKSSNINHY